MAKRKVDPSLAQAKILYTQRKFSQVISLLNPQIFLFRTNPEFYTVLGISCLYMNDFGGAHTYLSRAIDLDPRQVISKLGLAAVYLRRGKYTESLQQWLDVLQIEPDNKSAHYGLQLVRAMEESQDTSFDISESDKKRLYPIPPRNYRKILLIGSFLVGVLIFVSIGFYVYGNFQNAPLSDRPGGELLLISSEIPRLASEGDFEILLSTREIEQLLKDIAEQFDGYEDNRVRHGINRIQASNASQDIKTQMQLLLSTLRVPTFVDDFWVPGITQVIENPREFRNVYVRWSGRIGNLQKSETELKFDFLVGYETGEIIDAIVPVTLFFPANLQAGSNLELIGQLLLSESGNLEVQGTSIRTLR